MDSSEENIAIVVGNGFDIALGIKSSYNDFLNYLLSSYDLITTEEIYNFNKLFVQNFDGKKINWCDFELIFEKQIVEINQSLNSKELGYTKEFLISQINQNLRELEILFFEYLEQEFEIWSNNWSKIESDLNKKINSFYKNLFEKDKATIISFNYTSSIEKIFPKIKPKHIHGTLENGNIIFGGGFSGSILLENTSVKGSTENDKLIRSKKNPQVTEQRNKIFNKINGETFSSLFIVGHSIVGSDFILLKELFENSDKIYIFYFELDYEEKFQFLVQNLDKTVVEKIELVPFFEIIIQNDKIVISKETKENKDDYAAVSETFDFPIPSDPSDTFLNFEISTESFLLRHLKNLKINSNASLKALKNLLSKLSDEYADNISDEYFNIKIKSDTDQLNRQDISSLFELSLFKKIFAKAKIFELSNCEMNLIDLQNLIEINSLRKIKIDNNNIFYTESIITNAELSITNLSTLERINISNNEFINETEEDTKLKNFILKLTTKVAMKNKILEVQNNVDLYISMEIFEYFRELREIVISINSVTESLIELPYVEKLKLITADNTIIQPLPKLKLNSKIKDLCFENFYLNDVIEEGESKTSYKPLYLSTLFEEDEKKAILENIANLEFENCDIKGVVVVDFFANIFRNEFSPKIKAERDLFFSDFIKEPTRYFGHFVRNFAPEEQIVDIFHVVKSDKEDERNTSVSQAEIKKNVKKDSTISKEDIHLKFEDIFLNNSKIIGNFDLKGRKKDILTNIILKTSHILKVSEKILNDSFLIYKENQKVIPYIREIVASLTIPDEEFVSYYEQFVDESVKFRNKVIIIKKIWTKILETILLPVERGEVE
ncbi:hypothetical protein GYN67_03080 [Lactococcus piscium]|uniref:AbiH family protein n=1 Tax=Pseudolactococcus carnosus TaxID=2749961 RepID=UPI001FBBEEF3|nr:AbiH family protein [Lactococcus carnosus]MCJ1995679.1 hypothetical protein [Lactococcus carnosus]